MNNVRMRSRHASSRQKARRSAILPLADEEVKIWCEGKHVSSSKCGSLDL